MTTPAPNVAVDTNTPPATSCHVPRTRRSSWFGACGTDQSGQPASCRSSLPLYLYLLFPPSAWTTARGNCLPDAELPWTRLRRAWTGASSEVIQQQQHKLRQTIFNTSKKIEYSVEWNIGFISAKENSRNTSHLHNIHIERTLSHRNLSFP